MSTPRAKVYEISDAIQCAPDGFAAYYDRTTGRVEIVPAPDVLEEDEDDDESTDDMPEWKREEHELARRSSKTNQAASSPCRSSSTPTSGR